MSKTKWSDPLTPAERKQHNELWKKGDLDSRICLSIMWFESEADADAFGVLIRKLGNTYNGGWFDGMACGREKHRDQKHETKGMRYAVSF